MKSASFGRLLRVIGAPLLFAIAAAQYAAVEDGQLLADRGGGFTPRYYVEAFAASPAALKRDVGASSCAAGTHSCLDLGAAYLNNCCSDDQYCFLDKNWAPRCCALGSNCDSQCSESAYQCNITSVITTTLTVPATTSSAQISASATGAVTTVSTSTSLIPACCPRACTASTAYLCASEFGGGCCAFGQTCASNKQCLVPATLSTSALVTAVPSGCTTGQFSCATGGGCCNSGQVCTEVNSGNYCAPGGNVTIVDSSSTGGLSTGAKAGIAVGVVVAAAVVIGLLTWFCLRRRRSARQSTLPGGFGEAAGSGLASPNQHPPTSEVSGPSRSLPVHQSGLAYDYFGPNAVAGPYTEEEGTPNATPGALQHGVPLRPRGPADIAVPVEIDGRVKGPEHYTPATSETHLREGEEQGSGLAISHATPQEQEGPFELPGSLGTPSPLSSASPPDPSPPDSGPPPPGGMHFS